MQCQHKLKGEIRTMALQEYQDPDDEDPLEKLEEIGHNDNEQNFDHKLTSWPTSSNNSLGKSV